MIQQILREIRKWVIMLGLFSLVLVVVASQFFHVCLEGWMLLYVGIAALSGAVYIARRY